MKTIEFIISTDSLPERIDKAIAQARPELSRSFIQNLLESHCILINGIQAKKANTVARPGDTISVSMPQKRSQGALPLPTDHLAISILADEEDFLIVHKPAGVIVHAPTHYYDQATLVDWLSQKYAGLIGVGIQDRPGIVHRLDKDTSGLLIVAKNNQAHAAFSSLFASRTIEKTYYALVHGHPNKKGMIDSPIARDYKESHKMTAAIPSGRHALTYYKTNSYFKDTSLVELHPVTGRTHQIRVHLSSIGHPIIGDTVYGSEGQTISRQALHAYRLRFVYKNRYYSYSYDLPEDMRLAIKELQLTQDSSL